MGQSLGGGSREYWEECFGERSVENLGKNLEKNVRPIYVSEFATFGRHEFIITATDLIPPRFRFIIKKKNCPDHRFYR